MFWTFCRQSSTVIRAMRMLSSGERIGEVYCKIRRSRQQALAVRRPLARIARPRSAPAGRSLPMAAGRGPRSRPQAAQRPRSNRRSRSTWSNSAPMRHVGQRRRAAGAGSIASLSVARPRRRRSSSAREGGRMKIDRGVGQRARAPGARPASRSRGARSWPRVEQLPRRARGSCRSSCRRLARARGTRSVATSSWNSASLTKK